MGLLDRLKARVALTLHNVAKQLGYIEVVAPKNIIQKEHIGITIHKATAKTGTRMTADYTLALHKALNRELAYNWVLKNSKLVYRDTPNLQREFVLICALPDNPIPIQGDVVESYLRDGYKLSEI